MQEFRQALREMERAYRLFSHLHQVGPVAAGVEESKLHTHINFIAETHTKAQVGPEPVAAPCGWGYLVPGDAWESCLVQMPSVPIAWPLCCSNTSSRQRRSRWRPRSGGMRSDSSC